MGADFEIGSGWFFNVGLRYIQIEADARIQTQADGGSVRSRIKADLDPLVATAAVGWRF